MTRGRGLLTSIRLGLNAEDAQRELRDLSDRFGDAGRDISSLFGGPVGSALSGLGGQLGNVAALAGRLGPVATSVAAIGAAAVAAGAAVGAFVDEISDKVRPIRELSGRLGLSIENFSGLTRVAAEFGAEAEDVADVVKDLSVRALEAEDDFKKLGISVRDSNGNLLDAESLFYRVSDGIAAMRDDTERFRAADILASDAGVRLVEVMKQGGEAIRDRVSAMRQSGGVITEEAAVINREYVAATTRLGAAWDQLTIQIATAVTPAFTGLYEITADVLELFAGSGDSVGALGESLDASFLPAIRRAQEEAGALRRELDDLEAVFAAEDDMSPSGTKVNLRAPNTRADQTRTNKTRSKPPSQARGQAEALLVGLESAVSSPERQAELARDAAMSRAEAVLKAEEDLARARLLIEERYEDRLAELQSKRLDERMAAAAAEFERTERDYAESKAADRFLAGVLAQGDALAELELQRRDALEQARDALADVEDYERARFEIERGYARKRAALEQEVQSDKASSALSTAQTSIGIASGLGESLLALEDAYASESSKRSDVLFAIYQGVKIAETAVSTASAVMRGFSDLGPIGGAIFAPFIIATGLAQIGLIAAQSPRGGGRAAPTVGGAPSTSGGFGGGSASGRVSAREIAEAEGETAPRLEVNFNRPVDGRRARRELMSLGVG